MGGDQAPDDGVSLYTPEVKSIFHSDKPPVKGFIVDVVEFDTYLTLRVYRENFESYTQQQRWSIIVWLNEKIAAIRNIGTQCYPEVYGNVPR